MITFQMNSKSFFKKTILYPIETFFVYFFFYFFKIIPIDWSSSIAGYLMRYIGPRLKTSRTVALPNLSLAFPNLTNIEKTTILKDMWENLGRVIGELPHLMDICNDATRIHYKGFDYVYNQTSGERKKPLMLIAGHLGNWELLPVLTSSYHIKSTMIYRPPNNKYVDHLLRQARHAGEYMRLVNKGPQGAKALIKALRKNEMIGMLIDQKMDTGVKIKFLGTDAITANAPAEFAIKYQADILITRAIRIKNAYFEVEIAPPFDIKAFIKKHEDKPLKEQVLILTQIINDQLGEWIKENPSQWLWTHRRWTHRPSKDPAQQKIAA